MTKEVNSIKPLINNNIEKLYASLSIIMKNNKLNTTNILVITTNLMQIVEKYPKISGSQKKTLVVDVLKMFVGKNTDGENKEIILLYINTFLPSVIDTLISVDKKEMKIKTRKLFKKCFSCV